jgi:hypothetical protein
VLLSGPPWWFFSCLFFWLMSCSLNCNPTHRAQ